MSEQKYLRETPCGTICGTDCQWPGVAAYKGSATPRPSAGLTPRL